MHRIHLKATLGGLEHRQGHLALALVLPAHPHPHAAVHIVDRIRYTDNIGHHAETFVEVNVCEHIRPQLGKGRVAALHNDTEGIHRPLTLGHVPAGVERAAGGAMASGIENDLVAGGARLVDEFVTFRGFPEG
jgi:hypothetical protein